MTLPVRRLLKNPKNSTSTTPEAVFGDNEKRVSAPAKPTGIPFAVVGRSIDVTAKGKEVIEQAKQDARDAIVETANGASGPDGGLGGSTIRSQNLYGSILDQYLHTDIDATDATQMGRSKDTSINRIFRDMYYHDPVCGSGVDMLSVMPWSDFTLGGARNDKAYEKFYNSTASMNTTKLLPQASAEYFVYGLFCSTTLFNQDEGEYNGVVPQNIDFIEVAPVPIFGRDPLITLMVGEAAKNLIHTDDPRMKQYEALIPKDKETLRPKPEDVMYIPRRALMRDYRGVSIYRRLLTTWLFERALYRGTLDQSMKRQRSITHLMLGDTDWTPTQEEMGAMASNLVGADLDPVGAIFVTRTGVQVNDIRSANDLWKVTDNSDFFMQNKLRALGISEAFLSGEYSVNALDQAMSVFVENMRAFRDMMTYEMFYDKTFPRIAQANELMRKRVGLEEAKLTRDDADFITRISQGRSTRGFRPKVDVQMNLFGDNTYMMDKAEMTREDRNLLFIPEVHWLKRLRPEADDAYLGMLGTLQQAGVPIPLRVYAAAGGLNLDSIENQMDDDMELRKKFKPWVKSMAPEEPPMEGGAPGGGADGGDGNLDLSFVNQSSFKRRGVLNREYDKDNTGVRNVDSQGKRRVQTRKGKDIMEEKLNKQIAASAAILGQRINALETRQEQLFVERNQTKKFYV